MKNHPGLAPAGQRIPLILTATFTFKAVAYRIRLAELFVTDTELVSFK